MFDVRLRLMNDDGTPGRVLQTLDHSWNALGARKMRFTVAGSEKLAAPFLVAVEYSTGAEYQRPRDDLFIVHEDDADSIDTAGAVSFTAVSMFGWLAAGAPLWWRRGDTADLERSFTNRTPGYVLQDLITWMQLIEGSEGWGPHVTRAFTLTQDSAGNPWSQTFTGSWPLFTTTLSRAIDSLTSQGYCEVWTEGFRVHAVNAGTGADRTDTVTLGGPGFTKAPAKRKFDPATGLVVQHDQGWSYIANPGAETRFGQVFKVMSQSGAPNLAAAAKNAQPALAEARAMQEELSYEWTVAGSLPRPWVDFQIGDLVTARTRQGKKLMRVIGMDVSKDTKGQVTVRVVVGSKILDFEAKLAKRAASVAVGTIIGGSGATPPAAPSPATSAPVQPEGVNVASNTGAWRADGSAVSTVTVAWSAVTQNVDGMNVDVAEYEVWARRASEAPSVLTRTEALSVTTDQFEPGTAVYLMVRARSRAGVWSGFSPEISVTPAVPASVVPKPPTGLSVVSNTGAFQQDGTAVSTVTLGWMPVALSVDGKTVTIDEYEVLYGLEAMRVRTASATITVPAGKQVQVTVRPLSSIGVWGDPSVALNVTGALPTASTVAPSAPVVTAGMGGVSYRWDGLSSTGAAMPAGTASVMVDTAAAAAGPWTAQGAPLTKPGGGTIAGAVGTAVYVRFRAFDTLGRLMGASATASGVPAGVPVKDVPGLSGELDGIRYTADGSNRVYVSSAEPDRYRGTNRYTDPAFTDASYAPWSVVNGGIERTGTAAQGGVYVVASEIAVAPGDRFQVTATRQNLVGATGTASIYAQRKTAAGAWSFWTTMASLTAAGASTGAWATVPADTVAIRFGFFTEANMPATTKVRIENVFIEKARSGDLWLQLDPTGLTVIAVKVWNGTTWASQVLYADSILAAESITSPLIKAGSLEVDRVSPSFGASLDISASSSVQILTGKAAALEEQAAAQHTALTEQAAQVAANEAAAQQAAAGASSASIAAAAAQAAAAAAQSQLTEYGKVFTFDTDGFGISAPGSPLSVKLTNALIAIMRNGVARTTWDENQMIVPKLQAAQVVVGKTVITEKPTGVTWQRL